MSGAIFQDIDALRLGDEACLPAGEREVVGHVPVRKPTRTEFVRMHTDPRMAIATTVLVFRQGASETYLVAPAMRDELVGESKSVLLATAITRTGVVFLWPVPLPDAKGRLSKWAETEREGAALARTEWVRLASNMDLGAYRLFRAEGVLAEPVWPSIDLPALLEAAFRGRVIDSDTHPVVRQLRGLA